MDSMSAKSIGVDGIKVTGSDSTNADKAVDTISDAIKNRLRVPTSGNSHLFYFLYLCTV